VNLPTVFRFLGLLTFAAWIAQGFVNGRGTENAVVSGALFFLLFVSWIAAVYLWASQGVRGALHVVALLFLVPLGFLWGWAYLLARASRLPTAPAPDV
jgi:hypothetical protein